MAIEITPQAIKEIAEYLDMGMVCFYHKTSGEVESYPHELEDAGFDDEDLWDEIVNRIKQNQHDYLHFERMNSFEAFKVIQNFINTIRDLPLRNKFIDAVSRKKPFRQFDELLFHYPDLREQWFVYKLKAYILFVKSQVPANCD